MFFYFLGCRGINVATEEGDLLEKLAYCGHHFVRGIVLRAVDVAWCPRYIAFLSFCFYRGHSELRYFSRLVFETKRINSTRNLAHSVMATNNIIVK